MNEKSSSSTSIVEALERAAALHAEALRQVQELLRDDALLNEDEALRLELKEE